MSENEIEVEEGKYHTIWKRWNRKDTGRNQSGKVDSFVGDSEDLRFLGKETNKGGDPLAILEKFDLEVRPLVPENQNRNPLERFLEKNNIEAKIIEGKRAYKGKTRIAEYKVNNSKDFHRDKIEVKETVLLKSIGQDQEGVRIETKKVTGKYGESNYKTTDKLTID